LDLPESKENKKGDIDYRKALFPAADEVPLPRNWEGGWTVDQGMKSTASVWLDIDAAGYVCDRLLRKQVYQSRADWADATRWDGDVQDSTNRVPVEIACLRDLQAIPLPAVAEDAVTSARLRWYRVYDRIFKYTLYLEFCQHGDLTDVISEHGPRTEQGDLILALVRPIPEPFLWRVLHSLARVGLAMETGTTNDLPPTAGWKEIVHRDLRPANIFLDEPTARVFEAYPTPRLADFGYAFRTHAKDGLNPQLYQNGPGSRGFIAPEQYSYVDDFKLGSKTNVWSMLKPFPIT